MPAAVAALAIDVAEKPEHGELEELPAASPAAVAATADLVAAEKAAAWEWIVVAADYGAATEDPYVAAQVVD